MSEWVTDRRPTLKDSPVHQNVYVITNDGSIGIWVFTNVANGQAWMPIPDPPPYVEPKRVRRTQPYDYGDLQGGDRVYWIEVFPDDPADFDELIEAAHWLISIVALTDFKNGSGDRSLGENLAIDRLHDALKPRSKK